MAESPQFSVIVPVYNRIGEVRDLVDSLLAQTSNDFELIVVEDGSTAPCREIVEDAASRGLNASYYYKETKAALLPAMQAWKKHVEDGSCFSIPTA